MKAPLLIIGIGNPSRGDDALGPLCAERVQALRLAGVEVLTDYQLQVEYVLDLEGRASVVFVDASVSGPEPYEYAPVEAVDAPGLTSHALSPASLLGYYRRHFGRSAPPSRVLAIRGYGFELGEGPSDRAGENLDAAVAFLAGMARADIPLYP